MVSEELSQLYNKEELANYSVLAYLAALTHAGQIPAGGTPGPRHLSEGHGLGGAAAGQ